MQHSNPTCPSAAQSRKRTHVHRMNARSPLLSIFILACIAPSCTPNDNNNNINDKLKAQARIQWVQFTDPLKPQAINPPLLLRSARNETISFTLQLNSLSDLT